MRKKKDAVPVRGTAGGLARAAKLSPERRSQLASMAAKKRWETPGGGILSAWERLDRAIKNILSVPPQHISKAADNLARARISMGVALRNRNLDPFVDDGGKKS